MTLASHRSTKTYTGFLFFALVMAFILAILFLMPIQPNDYWWYLRVGADIVSTGAIPTVERLSYTQADAPVIYQTWLASVIFWAVNQAGGALATSLLRAVLVGGFYLCLWQVMRASGAGPMLSSLVLLFAALAGSNNWAVRPQLFAYPMFGISLWVITGWQNGANRRLWLLPLLSALWINLHGSYPLLFLLLGAAAVAGRGSRPRLLAFTAFAAFATFLNPLGPREWLHTFSLIQNQTIARFATEWQPPVNAGWQMNLFFAWLLAFAPLAALAPRRPTALDWLWFLGFGWMALSGLRFVVWFTAVLAVTTARLLSAWIGPRLDRPGSFSRPIPNLVIGILVLLLPLALLPNVRQKWWSQAPPNLSANTPVEAVAWLSGRSELPGQLWSDLVFSSYLTYALPQRPVWIHTQFEIFPPEHFSRYLDIASAGPNWDGHLRQDGVNLLLLSRQDQPALIQAVSSASSWRQLYQDEVAVIFARQPE